MWDFSIASSVNKVSNVDQPSKVSIAARLRGLVGVGLLSLFSNSNITQIKNKHK